MLKTTGGGLIENFYDLKREPVLKGEIRRVEMGVPRTVRETLALTNSDMWRILAVMAGIP